MWEPAMQTVALLGTAAMICVVVGIPLGIWFSRSDRAYAVARPILDLMQTMPSMVYLIPAIAFFGTGTPPGIIATLIFGLPPVVRLTTLGLRQVPAETRECARAYGASPWQQLIDVELPLALPSIMAGVNQTILMCLSMVVVAALIGAQGLGSVVLEALQFAATGQGILAGLAILLCAIVIDRLVQGGFRRQGRRGAGDSH
jgi:glycine betaine/proline transport system permease protein